MEAQYRKKKTDDDMGAQTNLCLYSSRIWFSCLTKSEERGRDNIAAENDCPFVFTI